MESSSQLFTEPQPLPELVGEYWQCLVELMGVCHDIEVLLWRSSFPLPLRLHTVVGSDASLAFLSDRLAQCTDEVCSMGQILLWRCRREPLSPARG